MGNGPYILQIIAITTKYQRRCSLVHAGVSLQTVDLETEVLKLQQASEAPEGLVKTRCWGSEEMTKDGKEDTCQVTSRPLGPIYQSFWSEPNTGKFPREAEQVWGAQSENNVPHQAETQVDSGQALVNMASFYTLGHAHSIPIKKHFSRHDCNR